MAWHQLASCIMGSNSQHTWLNGPTPSSHFSLQRHGSMSHSTVSWTYCILCMGVCSMVSTFGRVLVHWSWCKLFTKCGSIIYVRPSKSKLRMASGFLLLPMVKVVVTSKGVNTCTLWWRGSVKGWGQSHLANDHWKLWGMINWESWCLNKALGNLKIGQHESNLLWKNAND